MRQICCIRCRFILENSVLDKYVRFILSIYPAAIWAMVGVFTNNFDTAAPTRNNVFIGKEPKKTSMKQEITPGQITYCNQGQTGCT